MRGLRCAKIGLITLFLIFLTPISAIYGQTRPVELNYSIFFPATHKMTVLANEWGREIEKRTAGQVKITVFPGGTLTPGDKCYDGVVRGISDIGMSVIAYTRGRFPLSEVIDLPLSYKTGQAATRVINEFYRKFKPAEFGDVKILYLHAHGPGLLHTKKPVSRLEDLKGMKVRSHGLSAKIVTALGAVPVATSMPETYDALQKGIAEGVLAPIEALRGWRLGEVVKFTTLNFSSAYSTGFFVAMNKEKWNALTPEQQKIFEAVSEEWVEKTGKTWDEIDKVGRDFSLERGNKLIALTRQEEEKWAKAVAPILAGYVRDMKGKGLPGQEALNFCQELLRKIP